MKALSKLTLLVLLICIGFDANAQSRSYKIHDQFAHRDGFTSLGFSKSMLDAVNMNIDEENKKVTGDLMEIRILFANREKTRDIGSLANIISGKFSNMDYKKVEPKDAKDDDNVEFWIEGNSRTVKECHVIVKNSDDKQFSCLVSFYGNFKVEDLKSFEKFSRKQSEKEEKDE